MNDTATTLANEKYVVITTTRKNGQTVPTPVWIAPLADGAFGFTTETTSGKVKRIRNFPEVTLQPCSMRGVVKPGTSPVAARATVLIGDDVEPVHAAISAKYGVIVKLIGVGDAVRKLFGKSKPDNRAAIRLELVR